MIISDKTVQILKNFYSINENIFIEPGSWIRTVSKSDSVMAQAKVEDVFPKAVCLSKFDKVLAFLSMSKETDIEFHDDYMITKQGETFARFAYASPELVLKISGPPKLSASDLEFNLPWNTMKLMTDGMSIIKSTNLVIEGDGKKLLISAYDSSGFDRNANGNSMGTYIGSTDKKFRAVIEQEKLKFLQSNYLVSIHAHQEVVRFVGDDVTYWIGANEDKSDFRSLLRDKS